ncbi:lactate dehydrogenase [Lentzea sp. NBRC 105346]|nr:lactate dehydrogenase [Lentzea sp. NBRC 105346]
MDADVLSDSASRALYSADASNYRHVPRVIIRPKSIDAVVEAVAIAAEHGIPITSRGAGTSIAGNATGTGLVIDFSRYLDRIEVEGDRATVQPGAVLDRINEQSKTHLFGPDPSTHSRCSVGGMIGNNACGAHSVKWGKTSENVNWLDVLTADGRRFRTDQPPPLALPEADPKWFPKLSRRVSGYALDALPDLTKALIGTEGTCVVVLGAGLKLVPKPERRILVVLGFADTYDAADQVVALRELDVLAVEGIDEALVRVLPAKPDLPEGRSWLFVEVEHDSTARAVAEQITRNSRTVYDNAEQRALWRIREDGAGLATRMPDGSEAWSGWEDAAVPPENLGRYLRDFDALLGRHGRRGITYGHYGEGCIHVRIDFDFAKGHRRFLEEAADLVISHGGSLSGEHGDGQARGELLSRMYPPEAINAFKAFKHAFDPDNLLNPGRIVDPLPLDQDLRILVAPPRIPTRQEFAADTRRCVGVGKCLNTKGGVMCPSYRVTREEKHSTRGRAHLLFEMLNGGVIKDGWRSAEVRDALDLCLSCKGCKRDCPVDVDMAAYKAEFLHHHYKGRIRPASHYSMGWLPLWLRLNLVNRLTTRFRALGGIAPERELPTPARRTLQKLVKTKGEGTPVLLFPDTFTNHFEPDIGVDAANVLAHLGHRVEVPPGTVCCGLTWHSTGQLGMAERVLRRTARLLAPWTEQGIAVVGLEPSCTAFLRKDAPKLTADENVQKLAISVRTFAEQVASELPTLEIHGNALVQTHCHQYADLGFDADRRAFRAAGIEATVLDSGCCGLAGNFGFEKGHHEVSMACGERVLLPAVRATNDLVVADGFSCRTQIRQGSGKEPVHLATVIANALGLTSKRNVTRRQLHS